jgi:hypothetical protein
MTTDDLDRILAGEAPLQPSSGFTAAVMDQVRELASAPPPVPFPWRAFLLRLIFLAASAAVCIWMVATSPLASAWQGALARALHALEDTRVQMTLSVASLALAGTYLLVRLTLSFVGARR